MQRSSGILLHPSSLASRMAIGDFGQEAFRFVDFLVSAGQSIWQILPLGPTGYGHSPYNALSAFAGNPALIDLEQLVDCGDLDKNQTEAALRSDAANDFIRCHDLKMELLLTAGQNFFIGSSTKRRHRFDLFCKQEAEWLDDFCLFMALRDTHGGQSWQKWPSELRARDITAIKHKRTELAELCQLYAYQQFIFYDQWERLKNYANRNGVQIFGDIPIFVAFDSADVWANQEFFQLDNEGHPTSVAGVPPDYFSKTGQRWGNPLYRWDRLAAEGFHWWLKRFEVQLHLSDLVRIDHFRGFQACWAIPADEPTAVNGRWEEVPGRELFTALHKQRRDLPIIAEDLGIITPEVEQLRDDFGFPGMKILQFAFDSGPDNPYLPENHIRNCVVYTGTHDNNTTLGWWRSLGKEQKDQVRTRLGRNRLNMPWDFIELAMSSVADLCVIPCQDILSCSGAARLNTPGHATGNWNWQMQQGALSNDLAGKLKNLTEKHQRNSRR